MSDPNTKKYQELERQNRLLTLRVTELEDSLRFNLGDTLVSGLSNPVRLLSHTKRLRRIFRVGRMRSAWGELLEATEVGLPHDHLHAFRDNRLTPVRAIKKMTRLALAQPLKRQVLEDLTLEHPELDSFSERLLAYQDIIETGLLPEADERLINIESADADFDVAYVLHGSIEQTLNGYGIRSHAILSRLLDSGVHIRCFVRDGERPSVHSSASGAYNYFDSSGFSNVDIRSYIEDYASGLVKAFQGNRPRIVHAGSNYITGMAASLAAARLNIPFVYEVRGFWEVTRASVRPGYEHGLAYKVQQRLETEVARRASHVVTLSEPLKATLVKRGVEPDRISTAHNGATPVENVQDRKREMRARYGLPDKVFLIGFVGSVTAYEGLETLLMALSQLEDTYAVIVGEGDYLSSVKQRVADLKLESRVVYLGRVLHEEVTQVYDMLDATVYLRQRTAISELVAPLKPLESMAHGVPTIISDLPALTDLVPYGKHVLHLPPGDATKLAATLKEIAGDPEVREVMGQAARKWVKENRRWQHTADCIATVYAKLGFAIGDSPK